MQRLSVEEFKEADKLPLIVVLDDVRSMHNVGSVFRTGDAFRIEAVYLCGITSTPPMAEIHKTALGAEDSVSWIYFPTAMEALEALKAEGYKVYAIEQAHGSTMLQNFKPEADQKYAVILGNVTLQLVACDAPLYTAAILHDTLLGALTFILKYPSLFVFALKLTV